MTTETSRPVVIANATRFDFCSALNQRCYSISVALPLAQPGAKGCPVLYVLDGDWYFGSAVEAVRNNAPGVAVVGVGYPDDEAYIQGVLRRHEPLPEWVKEWPAFRAAVGLERMYDLSLPASDDVLLTDFPADSKISTRDVGGLEEFLKVLETEVKPRVAGLLSVDASNQVIFGHSLGGLAVVHALFVQPAAFRTFIAASPSIWWNEKAVLAGEATFNATVRAGTAAPRVLITMGSEEETADPKMAAQSSLEFEGYAARIRKARMVENARELTERLRAVRGSPEFEIGKFVIFPKQDHNISAWPALGRAVSFAFPS